MSAPTLTKSHHVFKRPCGWGEVPAFNARMNQSIDHGCNWNDGDVLYSVLESVLHREESSVVAIYCFGVQKTIFLSGLMDRRDIDITQLGCPPLADIIYQASVVRLLVTISDIYICFTDSLFISSMPKLSHS